MSVELDPFSQGQLAVLCNHWADTLLRDRPNGPYSQAMRELGAKSTLTDEEVDEVCGRAAAQMNLFGHVLEEERSRVRTEGLLNFLSLGHPDQDTLLAGLTELQPPSPQLTPTRAVNYLLYILSDPAQEETPQSR